jgi:hypothetical protein
MCINGAGILGSRNSASIFKKLSENAHLPFDKLMALSKVEASKGCVILVPRDCGA